MKSWLKSLSRKHAFDLGKNCFLKDFSNEVSCKLFMKFLISKFRKMNKDQELLNEYFGDILTRVLIFHISFLILIPMLFSSSNDSNFYTNLSFLTSLIWSFCVVYIICISPNILTKKVSVLLLTDFFFKFSNLGLYLNFLEF